MTPADETDLIAQTTKPPRLHSLWHALTSMRQGISARSASAYVRAREWVAESQEVVRHAGREAVIHLQPFTAAIVGRLRDPLMWLRFAALLCMLMGGLFRLAEPDSWLGRPFASHFEAAKAGNRTLLQPRITYLTRNDPGFQEILELALTSKQDLKDYIATEQIGPIETIHAPSLGLRFSVGPRWRSTAERMFRAPFRIQLEDRQGKSVTAILDYTEVELKARFFMPRLRWWATVALWAGFIIDVLLLPFPGSRKSHQPMREE